MKTEVVILTHIPRVQILQLSLERKNGKEYHLGMAASSTVVEHTTHIPKKEVLNPATVTGRVKMAKSIA